MKKYSLFVFVMYMIIGCNNSNPKSKKHIILDSSESAISNNTLKDSMQSVKKKSSDYVTSIKKTIKEKNEAIQLEKESTINTIFISNKNNKSKLQNTEPSSVINYDSLIHIITNIEVNLLPFGPEELYNNSFTKDGFYIKNNNQHDDNESNKVISFQKTWDFYTRDMEKNYPWEGDIPIYLPDRHLSNHIKSLKSKIVNDNNIFYYNEVEKDSLKIEGLNYVFNYRFPNFGKYFTYYITDFERENYYPKKCYSPFSESAVGNSYSSLNFCGKYGIIVLIDTAQKISYYIPTLLYDLGSNTFNMNFRFFYITKDKKILIYEGKSIRQKDLSTDEYLDEYKITLNKTHVISVDTNNEIVIENLIKDDSSY